MAVADAADAAQNTQSTSLAQLLADLTALEAKAVEYNALATQIHQHEQACIKDLMKQHVSITAFVKQHKQLLASPTAKHGDVDNTAESNNNVTWSDLVALRHRLRDLEYQFPRPTTMILRLALGAHAPVSLRPHKLRITYKHDYEDFKLAMTLASTVAVSLCLFVSTHRVMDALYQFIMLYYYCTVTLREHILVVNGSRIRKWWLTHHYISIVLSGVVLIWPPGETYTLFRSPFLSFCLFLCVVQVVQYRYQRARLYALVALDKARVMDTVIGDGVVPAAQQGGAAATATPEFLCLVPFLVVGQLWQLFISQMLMRLYVGGVGNHEWQLLAVAVLFGVLGSGNLVVTITTTMARRSFSSSMSPLHASLSSSISSVSPQESHKRD